MDERSLCLARAAATFGTPCFVYFMDDVEARVSSLRAAFDGMFRISYAMKCNPHAAVLRRMASWVDLLDVSSGGELSKALRLSIAPQRISFTGPAKLAAHLEAAVDARIGEVVLESVREAEQLDAIARARGRTQRVLVRVAPKQVPKGFGVNMAGRPCQFGIDEEDLDDALVRIRALPGLELAGFHVYSGTQCLKPEAIAQNYLIFLDIFRRASEAHGLTPQKLIFGSGLGIPYHDGDTALDLREIRERVLPSLRELVADPRFARAELVLETGRYLVGEAGTYLTRVVNRKDSRGARIATCDGGMNHHLGACGHLGMVLHRNYRIRKVSSAAPDAPEAPYDLYGPLCTTIDVLGRGVKLPGLEVGDVIGVASSGAYGISASPAGFISHELPKEILVERSEGELRMIDVSEADSKGEGLS